MQTDILEAKSMAHREAERQERRVRLMDNVIDRSTTWKLALEMVAPVIEQHGLEETKSTGMIFVPPSPNTVVEQHLDAIERVANWLLEPYS